MVGAHHQLSGVWIDHSVLLGSSRHADSTDGLGVLCVYPGYRRFGSHSDDFTDALPAATLDLALDCFSLGCDAISAGVWYVWSRGESLRFYIRTMSHRSNTSLERTPMNHEQAGVGAAACPGYFRGSASPAVASLWRGKRFMSRVAVGSVFGR